jgi:hypothetical protein
MKYVLLSADSNPSVFSVPDVVYDELENYSTTFYDKWLHENPDAAECRTGNVVCYNETDFIKYLNNWVFPDEQSGLVET